MCELKIKGKPVQPVTSWQIGRCDEVLKDGCQFARDYVADPAEHLGRLINIVMRDLPIELTGPALVKYIKEMINEAVENAR